MTFQLQIDKNSFQFHKFLPAYAPELHPVEYLWSHWKQHELPNFCPQNFGQLSS
jgi:transposase